MMKVYWSSENVDGMRVGALRTKQSHPYSYDPITQFVRKNVRKMRRSIAPIRIACANGTLSGSMSFEKSILETKVTIGMNAL